MTRDAPLSQVISVCTWVICVFFFEEIVGRVYVLPPVPKWKRHQVYESRVLSCFLGSAIAALQ